MKKVLSFLTIMMLASIMAACGSEDTAAPKENNKEEIENNEEELTQSEWIEKQAGEITYEITDQAAYAYIMESTDMPELSAFAVIKNTSKVAIDISNASVDFYDKDGGILTKSETEPSPSILQPGEVGYLATYEPGDYIDSFGEAKINISPYPTNAKLTFLSVENVKPVLKDTDKYHFVNLDITGSVKNDTNEKATNVLVDAALYDENGKFIAVMDGGIGDTLAPGASSAFELFNPKFSGELMRKVKKIEVKAYNLPEYMNID